MSKIGKKNIIVPSDVKVEISNNKINLEGPKGKKSLEINHEYLNVLFSDGKISIAPKDQKKQIIYYIFLMLMDSVGRYILIS